MAYLIVGLVVFFILIWAFYMSKASKDPKRKVKFEKPRRKGANRYGRLGRPIVQTDEQRSELIMRNRVNYDPSIDLLDPRNKDYRGPRPD